MTNEFSNQYYLESAPMKKAIAHLSIPMMIGMSVGTIYNVINAYFIGLLHNTSMLTAITLGLPIFTVLMAFGNVLGVGGGTFITRLAGQKETEKGKKVAGYTFYGSIVVGLLIALIAWLAINPITRMLGADAATLDFTKSYVLILFAGGFAVVLNFALEQLVRSEGASKESMYGIFISTALSLIFDPLFILVLNWHVAGAALAMVLANLGSAIYYIYFLETKSEHLRGFLKHFKISVRDQLEVYKIGTAELLQASFLIVSTLLLNNYSIQYGESVVAGFGVALRIVQIPEFLSMGLFLGLIPLFAFNFASKNTERLKSSIKYAFAYIGSIAVVFVSLVYVFRGTILHWFSGDPSVLSMGTYILAAMLISALFNGFTGLFMSIFQATGQGTPTTIMAISQGVLFIPMIIVLHSIFGLHGVIWSMTVTEVITSVMGVVLFMIFRKKLNSAGVDGKGAVEVTPV
ncbi:MULTISPECIES: MATE family efflux transporter [unclassified Paenibacillus]|uniref:MATE family efflux transporter n=1 Tax=unclassified Paenibacillus TaxID=185978 RepID=UPI002476FDDC|nr:MULTISPECIES: MATE family efflux transporter [unclassified Paenibacillus]MDH6429831.1 multidrug efflux pump [Paenibacillus sp. PastH-4]MDH6446069.1 multidrug efflux pump [Paenibacillus sp. PastF-4]MDH6530462.1 multidrug efflux pump [Paenibacillus sp. PastH-3]